MAKKQPKHRYKVLRLQDGKWAVYKKKGTYYSNAVYDTKEEAQHAAMWRAAFEVNDKFQEWQEFLLSNGFADEDDPLGWTC